MNHRERITRLEAAFSRSVNSQTRPRTRNELDGIISKIEPTAVATMPEPLRGMIEAIQKVRRITI